MLPAKMRLPTTVGMAAKSQFFLAIAAAVLGLPTKSRVIDGELIAAGRHGQPDFLVLLHGRHVPTCVYGFDLLELNGRDHREQPLVQRRATPSVAGARQCNVIRFSESFPIPAPAGRMRPPRPRKHRLQAQGSTLSIGLAIWLDQGQDPGVEGGQPVPREALRETSAGLWDITNF
jgi:hypothetical protein